LWAGERLGHKAVHVFVRIAVVGLLALIPASIALLLCRPAAYAFPEADVEIEIRIASLSKAEIS